VLYLPPAISINRFEGGYKSFANYAELLDTETADAANSVYTPGGNIDQRNGSARLYNSRLFSSGNTATGRPITGHYYFEKLGAGTNFHMVACGDSLFNYNSTTATVIRTGLSDNSNTFWSMIQIQDPRSASDDIVLATNGVNPIQLWNGSATSINLTSLTSATQVPVCKYLLNHKERIYAINIIDATDADAPAKVARTGFGTDGLADPHRFTESFYVGGSSKGGEIRGAKLLHGQIVFYTKNSIWKFNPSAGTLDLDEVQESVGLFAPNSLVDAGDFHIFLSERGVYGFDGNNLVHLSEKVDIDLFQNANLSQLQYAKAVFDQTKSQYILYFASSGSNRNDIALVYDIRPKMKMWQPPVTGRRVSFISTFTNTSGMRKVIYGDYMGYLYEDDTGINDGLATGYNGTVTASSYTSITDTCATFSTAGNGLAGQVLRIYEGTGEGQQRLIESNTSAVLTLESGTNWTVVPDTTSKYTVGGIDAYWRSRDYDFGGHDILKLFRHVHVRTKEEGNFNLTMHYIIDFRSLAAATKKELLLFASGFVWGVGIWNQVRWGGLPVIRKKVSLRTTANQSLQGTHFAVRFSNPRANESFRITGYDIEQKAIGKR
jgi:hypothetical protein